MLWRCKPVVDNCMHSPTIPGPLSPHSYRVVTASWLELVTADEDDEHTSTGRVPPLRALLRGWRPAACAICTSACSLQVRDCRSGLTPVLSDLKQGGLNAIRP